MKNKECKIVCENKELATLLCSKDGCNVKLTPEGKKMLENCNCTDCC